MMKFVQAGNDLFLDVKGLPTLPETSHFIWKFNGSLNIMKIIGGKETAYNKYRGRVYVQKYSLVLRAVQQTDSGEYTAYVSDDRDYIAAEHKVTVQSKFQNISNVDPPHAVRILCPKPSLCFCLPDPVSPVELRVSSVSRMSDSCNLTVTCSSQESHINSTVRCDTQTCSQEGGRQSEVPVSGASLHVYLLNASIVCNNSNQVNWTKEMADNLCMQNDGKVICPAENDA